RCLRRAAALFYRHAHPDHGGVPAGGNQRAEMRARGRGLVNMERLRIKTCGEGLDLVGPEGVAADDGALSDGNVLEIFHGRAPAPRRLSINGVVNEVITSSCSSIISAGHLTKPASGRLFEGRVSSTVVRTRTCVPGRSGLSQRTSSTPGAPMEVVWLTKPSAIMRIRMQQECHPEAASPPSSVARAAVSSRCIGCGSNSAAKATIASRVTKRGP